MDDTFQHTDENTTDPYKSVSETGNPYKQLDSDPDPSVNRGNILDGEEQELRNENQFDSAE